MTNEQRQSQSEFLPEIRLGKIGILNIHQISDEELTMLVEGSPQSLHLNFAIALLSIASSFLISMFTTTISADRVFTVMVLVTIVGYVAGVFLFFLWWKNRKTISKLAEGIRNRLPPEGEAQQI